MHKLAELTYAQVKDHRFEVAVLPLGATEPHNLHLPYATDTLQGEAIADRVCAAATGRGARVVLLPALPYGTETNMSQLPLAMNLNPSTVTAVVLDLVASVVASGIEKIVLLNLHGGNDLKPVLREAAGRGLPQLFLVNWWQVVGDVYGEIFEHPEDHAGEMETSLGLACFPELVRRDADGGFTADDGAVRPTRFEAVNRGWVSITRPWHLLTTNTGSGNPHAATAEKGERVLEVLVERLAPFLVELSETEIDEVFPF